MNFLAKLGAAIAALFVATFGSLGFWQSAHPAVSVPTTPVAVANIERGVSPATTSISALSTTAAWQWVRLGGTTTDAYKVIDGKVSSLYGPANPDNYVPGADLPTFEVLEIQGTSLNIGFARDRLNVYSGDEVIPGADPDTFVPLLDSFGAFTGVEKDKNHVYYGSSVISDAPNSFAVAGESIGCGIEPGIYFKDQNHVWYNAYDNSGLAIISAGDPLSFQVVSANNDPGCFHGAGGAPSTLESCGIDCIFDASDANHKYYQGQIVQ